MTIKHTKKDIGSEPQEVVVGIAKSGGTTVDQNTKNFTSDMVIKLQKQDQYQEESETDTNPGRDLASVTSSASGDKITIPLASLVRQEHLTQNYYTKSQVDAQVKPHYQILNSINNLPTAAQVRQAEHQNYIYLVPFADSQSGDIEYYEEYMYVIEGTDTSTEKIEKIGSTKINLSGLLQKTELNAELLNATNFTNLQTSVGTNASNITSLTNSFNTHSHGNITRDGKLNAASKVLVSKSNKEIIGVSKIEDSQVNVATVYNSIGNSANNDLGTVLDSVNTTISNINTTLATLPNYLLKSEIYDEIWGTNANGFRSMQTTEASDSASKNYKLGDYIYDKVYTKSDIDTLIGTLAQLQQQTLNIL